MSVDNAFGSLSSFDKPPESALSYVNEHLSRWPTEPGRGIARNKRDISRCDNGYWAHCNLEDRRQGIDGFPACVKWQCVPKEDALRYRKAIQITKDQLRSMTSAQIDALKKVGQPVHVNLGNGTTIKKAATPQTKNAETTPVAQPTPSLPVGNPNISAITGQPVVLTENDKKAFQEDVQRMRDEERKTQLEVKRLIEERNKRVEAENQSYGGSALGKLFNSGNPNLTSITEIERAQKQAEQAAKQPLPVVEEQPLKSKKKTGGIKIANPGKPFTGSGIQTRSMTAGLKSPSKERYVEELKAKGAMVAEVVAPPKPIVTRLEKENPIVINALRRCYYSFIIDWEIPLQNIIRDAIQAYHAVRNYGSKELAKAGEELLQEALDKFERLSDNPDTEGGVNEFWAEKEKLSDIGYYATALFNGGDVKGEIVFPGGVWWSIFEESGPGLGGVHRHGKYQSEIGLHEFATQQDWQNYIENVIKNAHIINYSPSIPDLYLLDEGYEAVLRNTKLSFTDFVETAAFESITR